jgi:hypothetical protein
LENVAKYIFMLTCNDFMIFNELINKFQVSPFNF